MRSLDEELAHEPDQRELDIRKAESLVELLDDLEHVDEVEPVPWELLEPRGRDRLLK